MLHKVWRCVDSLPREQANAWSKFAHDTSPSVGKGVTSL